MDLTNYEDIQKELEHLRKQTGIEEEIFKVIEKQPVLSVFSALIMLKIKLMAVSHEAGKKERVGAFLDMQQVEEEFFHKMRKEHLKKS